MEGGSSAGKQCKIYRVSPIKVTLGPGEVQRLPCAPSPHRERRYGSASSVGTIDTVSIPVVNHGARAISEARAVGKVREAGGGL